MGKLCNDLPALSDDRRGLSPNGVNLENIFLPPRTCLTHFRQQTEGNRWLEAHLAGFSVRAHLLSLGWVASYHDRYPTQKLICIITKSGD